MPGRRLRSIEELDFTARYWGHSASGDSSEKDRLPSERRERVAPRGTNVQSQNPEATRKPSCPCPFARCNDDRRPGFPTVCHLGLAHLPSHSTGGPQSGG